MRDLLEFAVAAHGGWERWQSLSKVTARASIKGAIWPLKGHPDVLANVEITAAPNRQHLEYSPFGAPGRHSVYEPDRTAIVTDSGEVVGSRDNPRQTFAGHGLTTPWDDQHLAYFSGYAMWTYLTTPFLFKFPGFQSEEVEPWIEDGETWRGLKVAFPAYVHSHCEVQTFYFDASGILRRHDYSATVLGGTSTARYALEPKTFDGFVFPTKHRIYSKGPDNRPLVERLAVSIDFQDISLG